jgi:hypothetical protein
MVQPVKESLVVTQGAVRVNFRNLSRLDLSRLRRLPRSLLAL